MPFRIIAWSSLILTLPVNEFGLLFPMLVDGLSVDDRLADGDVSQFFLGGFQWVLIDDHEIGVLADFD